MNDTKYKAARIADEQFQTELERVYGNDAGDARYNLHHDDAALIAAKGAFLKACEELWAAE